jgi:hypothetical protein
MELGMVTMEERCDLPTQAMRGQLVNTGPFSSRSHQNELGETAFAKWGPVILSCLSFFTQDYQVNKLRSQPFTPRLGRTVPKDL